MLSVSGVASEWETESRGSAQKKEENPPPFLFPIPVGRSSFYLLSLVERELVEGEREKKKETWLIYTIARWDLCCPKMAASSQSQHTHRRRNRRKIYKKRRKKYIYKEGGKRERKKYRWISSPIGTVRRGYWSGPNSLSLSLSHLMAS